MSEYKRLTMREKSGEALLAPYVQMDLIKVARLLVNRLAQHEDIGSPDEFAELKKEKDDGRILPEGFSCKNSYEHKYLTIFYPESKKVIEGERSYLVLKEKDEAKSVLQ